MSRQRNIRGRLGTRLVLGLGTILLAAVTGCGTKTNVKGTITYQGKTLDGGQVAFHASDGKPYSSAIKADGSYEIVNCPPGEVKITIDTPKQTGAMQGMDPSKMSMPPKDMKPPENVNAPKWPTVIVPDVFKVPESTDLKYTVTSGDQSHNIKIGE
jgi:hypothetical protein